MSISQAMFFTAGQEPSQITAEGGTITTEGDYRYHEFTSTGSITFTAYDSSSYLVYVLLIAGGDGGQNGAGNSGFDSGDGGQGGFGGQAVKDPSGTYTTSDFGINTARTVTIGAGGASNGGAGTNTSIVAASTKTALASNYAEGQYGLAGVYPDPGGDGGQGGVPSPATINTAPFTGSWSLTIAGGGGGGGGGGGYDNSIPDWTSGGSGGAGGGSNNGTGGSGGVAISTFSAKGENGANSSVKGGGGGGGGGAAGWTSAANGGTGGQGSGGRVVIAYKWRNN